MATVAQVIVKKLVDAGVKNSYGYPGSLAGFLMDALRVANESRKISNLTLPSEQACSFAAIGDSQTSGKPTLCWSTSGPGATNLVTGIADAFYDSVPVIFITSNVSVQDSREFLGNSNLRQNGNQETDIVSIVKPITKFAARADSPTNAITLIEKAINEATSGRKGPVLIDIPISVAKQEVDFDVNYNSPDDSQIKANQTSKSAEIEMLLKMQTPAWAKQVEDAISKSSNTVLVLGGGVANPKITPGAIAWVIDLLNANPKLRVAFTMQSADLRENFDPEWHDLYFPTPALGFDLCAPREYTKDRILDVLGVWGEGRANEAVKQSDLVVSIGSRLSNRQVAPFGSGLPDGVKLIRVDIDVAEFSRQLTANQNDTIDIEADFTQYFLKRSIGFGQDCTMDSQFPVKGSRKVSNIVTADVGQNMWRIVKDYIPQKNDRILFSAGSGCMGCSLPTAIGAVSSKNCAISAYAFCGDGSLQMSMENLNYIAQNNLPISVILYNNNSLGLIHAFQTRNFAGSLFSTTENSGYSSPQNWKKIAKALGFEYICTKVTNPNDLIELARKTKKKQRKNKVAPIFIEAQVTTVYP